MFSPEAERSLVNYQWPGNVREAWSRVCVDDIRTARISCLYNRPRACGRGGPRVGLSDPTHPQVGKVGLQ
jgi:hypothetical protein